MPTDFTPHQCYVCERPQKVVVQHLVPARGFCVLRCTECGLVFTAQLPITGVHQVLQGASDGKSKYRYWSESEVRAEEQLFNFYRGEAKLLLDLLPPTNGDRLLEVGCSFGVLLDEARKRGYSVTGLEADPLAADYARKKFGIQIYESRAEETTLKERFNVIVANDIIEHLLTPMPFLRRLAESLLKGGLLLIQTPSQECAYARMYGALNRISSMTRALSRGKADLAWSGYYDFNPSSTIQRGHVLHFTSNALLSTVQRVGLSPVFVSRKFSNPMYLSRREPNRQLPIYFAYLLARLLCSPNKHVALFQKEAA